ncbi:MAG: hypothetical protein Q9211_002703 [Gyalolechia sp. 1 TL-2023]
MGGGVEEELGNIASLPGNISGVNTGRIPSFTFLSENGEEQDNLPETSSGPGPPPNGGLRAWQQVLGAFFLKFNTWGLVNTSGIFQDYYASGAIFTAS